MQVGRHWHQRLAGQVPGHPSGAGEGGGAAKAGRALHRRGRADVEVEPGQVIVRFVERPRRRQDSGDRDDPAFDAVGASTTATVSLRPLSAEEWQAAMDELDAQPARAAAALAGELPAVFVDLLLPVDGELSWICSCEEWDEPCRHVWAVLHDIGDRLDADPSLLLVLRGRSRADLVDALRSESSSHLGPEWPDGGGGGDVEGDDPRLAYQREIAELPRPLPLPWQPGRPVDWPVPAPADSGIDPGDLRALAADAANRATLLLTGDGTSGLYLTSDQDIVRRAADEMAGEVADDGGRDRGRLAALALAAGTTETVLAARAQAWRRGGVDGLVVHDEQWTADTDELAAGFAALGGGRRVANLVQHQGTQLRLDRSRQWWRFRADDELGWVLDAGPFDDPYDAVP